MSKLTILLTFLLLIGCMGPVYQDAVYLDGNGDSHLLTCTEEGQPNGRVVLQCHLDDTRGVW